MDFLDPIKQRANRIRLFVGYGLMAILIITSALLLMYRSLGFNFDFKNRTVVQNGLMFIDSVPGSATIYINGQIYKNRTNARVELPAGDYTIELKADGFASWKRSLQLEGGTIEQLIYPKLFPASLKSNEIQLFASSPSVFSQSPDQRWIIKEHSDQFNIFSRYDLNSSLAQEQILNFPSKLFTAGKKHSFKEIEWSADNVHLLIEHSYDDVKEFILLDVENPAQSVVINKTLNINPTSISMRNKSAESFYFLDGVKNLSRVDLKDKVVTLIAQHVLAYKSSNEEMIMYVEEDINAAGFATAKIKDQSHTYSLRQMSNSSAYLLSLMRFNNSWYMGLYSGSEGKAYIYKDPQNILSKNTSKKATPLAVLKGQGSKTMEISANSRFVALTDGSKFSVYDAEKNKQYRYSSGVELDDSPVKWLDGFRLQAVSKKGKLTVFDFDGSNIRELQTGSTNTKAYLDHGSNTMYSLSPSSSVPGRYALFQTSFKLEK